jgi:hypothetical protein
MLAPVRVLDLVALNLPAGATGPDIQMWCRCAHPHWGAGAVFVSRASWGPWGARFLVRVDHCRGPRLHGVARRRRRGVHYLPTVCTTRHMWPQVAPYSSTTSANVLATTRREEPPGSSPARGPLFASFVHTSVVVLAVAHQVPVVIVGRTASGRLARPGRSCPGGPGRPARGGPGRPARGGPGRPARGGPGRPARGGRWSVTGWVPVAGAAAAAAAGPAVGRAGAAGGG